MTIDLDKSKHQVEMKDKHSTVGATEEALVGFLREEAGDCPSWCLIDTGCSRAMMSEWALEQFLVTLTEEELDCVQVKPSDVKYGFAGGASQVAHAEVCLPCPMLGVSIRVQVLSGNKTPVLLSLAQLKRLKAKLDLGRMKVQVSTPMGERVLDMRQTSGNHAAVVLTREFAIEKTKQGSKLQEVLQRVERCKTRSGNKVFGSGGPQP